MPYMFDVYTTCGIDRVRISNLLVCTTFLLRMVTCWENVILDKLTFINVGPVIIWKRRKSNRYQLPYPSVDQDALFS